MIFDVLKAAEAGELAKLQPDKRPEVQRHFDLLNSRRCFDLDKRLSWEGYELLAKLSPRPALEAALAEFKERQVGTPEETLVQFLDVMAMRRMGPNAGKVELQTDEFDQERDEATGYSRPLEADAPTPATPPESAAADPAAESGGASSAPKTETTAAA